MSPSRQQFTTIGGIPVWRYPEKSPFFFLAAFAIDADGAPNAYHADDIGIDYLANAGRPGNWWGLATDNGQADGTPVIQDENDPCPGYYVSRTSLEDRARAERDPRRYVDATKIPYVVLPPQLLASRTAGGARLGDFAAVMNTVNRKFGFAIFADVGPKDKLGERSIALAQEIGVPSDPKRGGAKGGIAYLLFPGSGDGKPRSREEIVVAGTRLLDEFGGDQQLRTSVSDDL
jgi:Fungal chitosanase of glycosyl hydrolase group 75